jgi:hypothetical protein
LFDEYRYLFYITNDRTMTAEEVVFSANDRCDQENLSYLALHSLWRADPSTAAEHAQTILSNGEKYPPGLVLKAADILAHQTRALPADQARHERESLIPILQDFIFRLETSGEAEVHPNLLGAAFGLIDACQRQVG